jgi:hypothetical protein
MLNGILRPQLYSRLFPPSAAKISLQRWTNAPIKCCWQVTAMVPAGYLAKRVSMKPDWLQAPQVADIYSVSGCMSETFADYIEYWKHNGFWLFDSPEVIENLARENSIDLTGTTLFYYEVYEKEFDGDIWHPYEPDSRFKTSVEVPVDKHLEGFDVVTFSCRNEPECSPLSCNNLAQELPTNSHCLFQSFNEAENNLTKRTFNDGEPGPYRIFSVYSVNWPNRRVG